MYQKHKVKNNFNKNEIQFMIQMKLKMKLNYGNLKTYRKTLTFFKNC